PLGELRRHPDRKTYAQPTALEFGEKFLDLRRRMRRRRVRAGIGPDENGERGGLSTLPLAALKPERLAPGWVGSRGTGTQRPTAAGSGGRSLACGPGNVGRCRRPPPPRSRRSPGYVGPPQVAGRRHRPGCASLPRRRLRAGAATPPL